MFAEIYVEALLADEKTADMIWEHWDAGDITDQMAAYAWCVLVTHSDPVEVFSSWARCRRNDCRDSQQGEFIECSCRNGAVNSYERALRILDPA